MTLLVLLGCTGGTILVADPLPLAPLADPPIPVRVENAITDCGPEGVGIPDLPSDFEAWFEDGKVEVWRVSHSRGACHPTSITASRLEDEITIHYEIGELDPCGDCAVSFSFELHDLPAGAWTLTDGTAWAVVDVP